MATGSGVISSATTVAFGEVSIEQHAAVPGTVLVAVRAARHPDFDRFVLEFTGPLPSHRVEYVPELPRDGSGEVVLLPGRAIVQIVVQPADDHDEAGLSTLPGAPAVKDFAVFRQILAAGAVEGALTWGIGVADHTGVRVVEFDRPSRVAIDVQHVEPGTGNQLLEPGDRSSAVATWQWRLNQAERLHLAVDEDFGPRTEAATAQFQRRQHLQDDGIVGPRTRAAMRATLRL
jgi:hypothetical protein